MKRTITSILCILLGLLIGVLSIYVILFKICEPEAVVSMLYSDSFETESSVSSSNNTSDSGYIVDLALKTSQYIKNGDFSGLSSVVHPVYGVVFTPYSTVNLETDKCFSSDEVAAFGTDSNQYVWGKEDGSGDPIEMTVADYFSRYVNDKDYTQAPVIGVNHIVQSGNSLENVSDIFPDAKYIDLCYPSESETPDWSVLRLVFEDYEGELKLVAVIHGEWTI